MPPLNEYDDLLAGRTPAPANEYDALLHEQRDNEKTALRIAMHDASTADPDRRARALQFAERYRLPVGTVERNLELVEQRDRVERNDYDQLLTETPALASWLTEPDNAALAKDDVENLTAVETVLRKVRDYAGAFAQGTIGHVGGGTLTGLGELWHVAQRGVARGLDVVLPDAAMEVLRTPGPRWLDPGYLLKYHGRSLKALGEIVGPPEERRGIGTDIASGTGQLAGQIFTHLAFGPFASATTLTSQGADVMAEKTRGDLAPQAQKDVAILAGATITALTERYGLQQILSRVPPAIRNRVLRQIADISVAGGIEAAQEFIEGLLHDLARITLTNAAAPILEGVDREMIAAGGSAAIVRGVINAALGVRTRANREREEMFSAIGDAAAQSKLRERLPGKLQDLIERMTKDSALENVYVPIEAWQTYWQGAGVDPRAAAADVLGNARAYDEAVQTGVDLTIPTARYAVALAGTAHNKALAKDLRTRPNEMSVREADAWIAAQQEIGEAATTDPTIAAAARIREDLVGQLLGAGFEQQTAETYGQLYEATFRALAERTGQDPVALFDRYALRVERALPAVLARLSKAEDLDVLLERVRAGERPSDPAQRAPLEGLAQFLRQVGIDPQQTDSATIKQLLRGTPEADPGTFAERARRTFNQLLGRGGEDAPGAVTFAQLALDQAAITRAIAVDQATRREGARDVGLVVGLRTAEGQVIAGNAGEIHLHLYARNRDAARGAQFGFVDRAGKFYGRGEAMQAFAVTDAQQLLQEKRGAIHFGHDRRFQIELLEKADLSTFLHETGHFYLEVLGDLAEDPNAPTPLRDDYQAVLDWLGVKTRAEIKAEQHEQWARGFEAYLMEGKSPTPALARIYARFRAWLIGIYRSLARLNVQLTDDVRAVMDRLVASEEEIAAARSAQAAPPLFTDAAQAGMTPEEFARYQQAVEAAREAAETELAQRLIAEHRREQEAWWRDARAKVREEVEAEVNAQPVYIALAILTRGTMPDGSALPEGLQPLKLDRAAVADLKGEAFLKRRPFVYAAEGGMHPDQAAELLGFSSGDELLFALAGARPRTELIEAETDSRMRARHGDMRLDGSIALQALDAVHNERRGELLVLELQKLSGRTRRRAVPLEAIRAHAARAIAGRRVRDIHPGVYLRAEGKAARAAFRAVANGDFETAFVEKQRELLNHELYRAAAAAREDTDGIVEYLRTFGRRGTRERIGKAGADYLEQIDAMLERVELKPVPVRRLESRQSLRAWIQEKEAAGEQVAIDPAVLADAQQVNYKDLAYEHLVGVRDAVKNIAHLARLKNRLLRNARQREIEAVAAELEGSIRDNAPAGRRRKIETHLPREEAARAIDGFFAAHRKFASYARQMDGFKDGGPLWEYLVRPLNEAADAEAVRNQQATRALWDLFKQHGQTKDLYKKQFIPALGESLTKMGRLMVALNWGNADNRAKLMDGYDWTEGQVDAVLDTLEQADWDFVQAVWDHVDSYWPEIKAKEERVTGVAPAKVEAAPVQTKFGPYRGGYFPLKYDERQSPRAYAHAVQDATEAMLRGHYTRATTRRGHTKERVQGVRRPVRLDFGVIFEHVSQVVHDLTHHEALLDVNRLLGNDTVQHAIVETYGDQVYRQLQHVVADVAAGDVPAMKAWERAVNWIRTGTSIAAMGWNVSTGLIQTLGLSQSLVRVGPKWIGRGLARWTADAARMENTAAWIFAKSDFMRLRGQTMMREINEIRNRIRGRATLQAVQDTYFWLIVKMQQTVDIPTWLGQYEKAMADPANVDADGNVDEARAIALADQAVIDTQGSGHIKDLAEMQRGSPLMKLWTNFYHYFNTTLNLTAESFHRTHFKHPAEVGRFLIDLVMLYTVPAVLGYLIREGLRGGGEDDEDKLLAALAREQLGYIAGTLIGVRELSGVLQGYYGYEGPAGTRLFAELGQTVRQVEQGEVDEALLRSLNRTAGILFHYPAGQLDKMVRGYFALEEGETENPAVFFLGPPPNR